MERRVEVLPRDERGKLRDFADVKRTPLINVYLLPFTLKHLSDLEEALAWSQYQDPIVLVELKPALSNHRTHEISKPRIFW